MALFSIVKVQQGGLVLCYHKHPYYCHYLAWRLGTWSEHWFQFFDDLLACATRLRGWHRDRIPRGCEFDKFWSFVWELKVAAFFASKTGTSSVEWTGSGPDLKVTMEAEEFFVECTAYHKSFGIEEFINELLRCIHPGLGAEHILCTQFSLRRIDLEAFLHELFDPFLDTSFLPRVLREAQRRSPALLPCPAGVSNLFIYLETDDARSPNPDQPWRTAGDPERFLQVALTEVLANKHGANQMQNHRPNLLAVNFLLGRDFQLARSLRPMPQVSLPGEIDGIFVTSCGIDRIPSREGAWIQLAGDHPVKRALGL